MNNDRTTAGGVACLGPSSAVGSGLRLGLLALGSCLLLARPVAAQDPAAAPSPEPPKIDVTAFVDAYYEYNFNGVDPALRSFDVQHDAFSLSLADVALSKGVTPDSRLGFRAELAFGKTADLI